jgi:hypothetical protein
VFPTQLLELLCTYHVIKQCTEKETTSLSIFLLTIKLNYIHGLYVIIPVHGIGSMKITRRQITCYCPRKMLLPRRKITRPKLCFYYTCKFDVISINYVIRCSKHWNTISTQPKNNLNNFISPPIKISKSKCSPQLQYLCFRIMCFFSGKWVYKQVLKIAFFKIWKYFGKLCEAKCLMCNHFSEILDCKTIIYRQPLSMGYLIPRLVISLSEKLK